MQNIDVPAIAPQGDDVGATMHRLAEELGSVGDIDERTGNLLFKTIGDATSFKEFCDARNLPVTIEERKGATPEAMRFAILPNVPAPSPVERTEYSATTPAVEEVRTSTGETFKGRFERVLKGRFAQVPKGKYVTKLPPFTSLSLIPAASSEGRHSLNIAFFYASPRTGKDVSVTFSLSDDGVLFGRIPNTINLTKDQLKEEVLRIMEVIDINFWRSTELDVLTESDPGPERGPQRRGEGPVEQEPIDPERLKTLRNLGGAFGFYNRGKGFNGYEGVLVPGSGHSVVVIDNKEHGNAAFVVQLPKRVEVPPQPVSKADSDRILEQHWKPFCLSAPTRRSLAAVGNGWSTREIGKS